MKIIFTRNDVFPYEDPTNDQDHMLMDELIWDLKKTLDLSEALNYNRIQAIVINRGYTILKSYSVGDDYIMELEYDGTDV